MKTAFCQHCKFKMMVRSLVPKVCPRCGKHTPEHLFRGSRLRSKPVQPASGGSSRGWWNRLTTAILSPFRP